jgi:hypothetical protein
MMKVFHPKVICLLIGTTLALAGLYHTTNWFSGWELERNPPATTDNTTIIHDIQQSIDRIDERYHTEKVKLTEQLSNVKCSLSLLQGASVSVVIIAFVIGIGFGTKTQYDFIHRKENPDHANQHEKEKIPTPRL